MALRYPAEAEAFRAEVQAFLDEHLPADWQGIGAPDRPEAEAFTLRWRRTLFEHRMLGIAWPTRYGGGGRTKLEQVVLAEELARARDRAAAMPPAMVMPPIESPYAPAGIPITRGESGHVAPAALPARDQNALES